MKRPGRKRQRQDIGLGDGHISVLPPGPVERGPGQIDPDGVPALSSEVGNLGSQAAADVNRGTRLAEPSISLGRNQLGRRSTEVPPAVDAIAIGVSHSPNDPTSISSTDQKAVPAACRIRWSTGTLTVTRGQPERPTWLRNSRYGVSLKRPDKDEVDGSSPPRMFPGHRTYPSTLCMRPQGFSYGGRADDGHDRSSGAKVDVGDEGEQAIARPARPLA